MLRKSVFRILMVFIFLLPTDFLLAQPRTYCNPMNLDYGFTPIPNFSEQGRHRATADPVITLFKGDYYLFSTNQWGYWWSNDFSKWNFVPRKFLKPWHNVYDELCAPATLVLGDTLLLIGSTHAKNFPLWMSKNPRSDSWTEAIDSFRVGAWDPAFFANDDGRVYCYWGSSNFYPIYGIEIDRKTFKPIGERKELISLQPTLHGWERFGEANDNTFLSPFMEGAWMNKHNNRYFLQYGAPGTEFSGYGDGVYVSENPLGPFSYQDHNPFAYKPGGFARGAGHGATFQDKTGEWWHVSTIIIGTKNNFERRLGVWPSGFDADNVLYCNTAYGDFPHFLPGKKAAGSSDYFTRWMLLNYQKPVQVSSTLGGFSPNFVADEDIKTYWSAQSGSKGEWLQTDLGAPFTVNAIQINYADQDADLLGKNNEIFHQYRIYHSANGKKWQLLVDKSKNTTDVPHDYVELEKPVVTRFLKLENLHVAAGKFAISGFRVFGNGHGKVPEKVRHLAVLRGDSERRNAWLKWELADDAQGYVIYTGIAPDKLYSSIMVWGINEYYFRGMTRDKTYYFQIEAFNENGIGERTEVVKVD